MKLNILIPTLLSTFLSLYVASSQPLQTTITTTTNAFDFDGHEVQPGIKYYVAPSQSNDNGGGLSLASRDGFCPPFVVQENSQLSKGLSLRFLPLDTKQNTITLSSDLNIVFNAATICVQSTVWRDHQELQEDKPRFFIIFTSTKHTVILINLFPLADFVTSHLLCKQS
ncbi:alpha-amylase/subtilisin inhibitor [Artemisia annua]|uniref:Alpha-amylase/subtilisin inhibitor n=1 Tax=Artemisia annua TaxID=35608 RepID=A0A2U1L0X3_ARTAN|nr:alpha-amylase/subtilisin inhibitor [Artemisia annua]